MHELTEHILHSGKVVDADGNELVVHSHTSREQCKFLQQVIADIDARRCLEVGLAFGLSALSICESIFPKEGSVLHAIDPFQDGWKNVGLRNLQLAGFEEKVIFHREHSHSVLPKLLTEGLQLDFAYVDSTKIFDVLLVDAYYLSMLLRQGGVLVLDDCIFPGVRKLARYLSKLPYLKVYACFGRLSPSWKISLLSALSKPLPYRDWILNEEILRPASDLGVHAQCVAFQKTGDDHRNWDWFIPF